MASLAVVSGSFSAAYALYTGVTLKRAVKFYLNNPRMRQIVLCFFEYRKQEKPVQNYFLQEVGLWALGTAVSTTVNMIPMPQSVKDTVSNLAWSLKLLSIVQLAENQFEEILNIYNGMHRLYDNRQGICLALKGRKRGTMQIVRYDPETRKKLGLKKCVDLVIESGALLFYFIEFFACLNDDVISAQSHVTNIPRNVRVVHDQLQKNPNPKFLEWLPGGYGRQQFLEASGSVRKANKMIEAPRQTLESFTQAAKDTLGENSVVEKVVHTTVVVATELWDSVRYFFT